MSSEMERQWTEPEANIAVEVNVDGQPYELDVIPRRTLADALRTEGWTSIHMGCEHGVCGACTILVDGAPVRSCLMLAVQAHGCEIETAHGLADGDDLTVLQQAFDECGALQCGFCTPGFLMLVEGSLRTEPDATKEEMTELVASNLCRCTGGIPIVKAALAAQAAIRDEQ